MPLLALLLGGLFTRLIDYFALYFTRKIAIYLAAVAALTALTAALFTAFTGLIAGVSATIPVDISLLTAFLPSNLTPCLSAVSAAYLLKWAYDWNTTLILKNMS